MSHILMFSKMRLLIKSFDSQFSYCPLIWMSWSRSLNNKINKLQERVLCILYKDYDSSFEDLLEKDNSDKIHDRNIKLLAKEVYKVENNILPNVLGSFITKQDLQYNLRDASTFLRDKVIGPDPGPIWVPPKKSKKGSQFITESNISKVRELIHGTY